MAKYDKETKFYWLQLKEDFFEDDAIEWLEEQKPNGRDYAYFYLKLCLKALKSNGILIRQVGNILIPYDNRKLAELTKMDFDTVTVAMELLKQIGLVEILENGEIYITQLENLIGSTSKGAFKKQLQLLNRKEKQNKIENAIEKSENIKILTYSFLNKQEIENDIDFDGLPKLSKCKRLSREQILLPTGEKVFVDEKRYGGNGGLAYERANGLCEDCGATTHLRIHHENLYSNELKDLIVLCEECHGIHHSKEYLEKKEGWTEGGKISTKDKDKDKDKVKVKDKNIYSIYNIGGTKKFEKPTLEELENYKLERKSSLDVQKFYNYYEANGWKVGKNPMKDWKATFRYWERNEIPKQTEENLPSWYGKEIKKREITTEEQDELKDMLKEFEE